MPSQLHWGTLKLRIINVLFLFSIDPHITYPEGCHEGHICPPNFPGGHQILRNFNALIKILVTLIVTLLRVYHKGHIGPQNYTWGNFCF